jgi:hypothetical protein
MLVPRSLLAEVFPSMSRVTGEALSRLRPQIPIAHLVAQHRGDGDRHAMPGPRSSHLFCFGLRAGADS